MFTDPLSSTVRLVEVRMILKRFRLAFQRQDWFAVALELLVVVFGVAIAFQIEQVAG